MRTGEPEYRYAKNLFNIEKKIIIMKMARGNKYFQDNYDRKYGIQYMDNLTRHAIKKFFGSMVM